MPNGMTNRPVTAMSEGNSTNPIDAAAEITDAMMSSLADVVKTVISKPDGEKSLKNPQQKIPIQCWTIVRKRMNLLLTLLLMI